VTDKPFLSVIVPLPDHRGHALEAIESWTRQNCPRSDYEVVVIIDGREPELEATVASLLTSGDQTVCCEEGSLHDCYNEGARAARGQVLLFTESHVKADRDCIAGLIARFARGDVDGLAVASGGIDETRFAAQEQTIYEEALPDRIAGGWNLCTVRGCAIERNAFHRAGGFRSNYGHFSEILLGATLRHNGARLRYAERARVWHFNSGNFAHFGRELTAYGGDEIRFRADHPNSPLLRYLGPSQLWDNRHAWLQLPAARRCGELLRAALKDLVRGRIRGVGRALAKALPEVPTALLGPRWLSLKASWYVLWTRLLLFVCAWSDQFYYCAFCAMWNAQIHRGRTLEIARQLAARSSSTHRIVEPAIKLAKAA
jgi:glycosyltransferase involved in cell wall biosynthesis